MDHVDEVEKVHENIMIVFQRFTEKWALHLYSVWLFTFSDLKTIVLPSTAFALLNGVAVSLDSLRTSSSLHLPLPYQILLKTPTVLLWVWVNLLPFTINKQRQPEAIQEDSMNKTWRTIPSRRPPPESAKRLMLAFYLIAIIISLFLGNLSQCLALVLLGHW